jgi:hypothetical protein
MFSYFHKNKLQYQKGQLAPFFIVLLVILIIMAMVTVNLSKVAFIKTESSNAVDAGALAAGSVMANLFNAIGQSNRVFEEDYRWFYDRISVLFVGAIEFLVTADIAAYDARDFAELALQLACIVPCAALILTEWAIQQVDISIQNLSAFIGVIEMIQSEVQLFHDQQFAHYLRVRETSREAHCRAKKMGHKFCFMNSGIGNKLKDRSGFTNFLSNLNCDDTYTYNWTDGQGRAHNVESKVNIDPVDTFELKVTRNTLSQEMALLAQIINRAQEGINLLQITREYYVIAEFYLFLACFVNPLFCIFAIIYLDLGINTNTQAIDTLKPLFDEVPEAWQKLLPSDQTFISTADFDAFDQIICWIEEIIHNRLVRVDSTQQHAGREEPGVWTARYPEIKSFSVVSFLGQGQIHRKWGEDEIEGPVLRHTPSIIQTDE